MLDLAFADRFADGILRAGQVFLILSARIRIDADRSAIGVRSDDLGALHPRLNDIAVAAGSRQPELAGHRSDRTLDLNLINSGAARVAEELIVEIEFSSVPGNAAGKWMVTLR